MLKYSLYSGGSRTKGRQEPHHKNFFLGGGRPSHKMLPHKKLHYPSVGQENQSMKISAYFCSPYRFFIFCHQCTHSVLVDLWPTIFLADSCLLISLQDEFLLCMPNLSQLLKHLPLLFPCLLLLHCLSAEKTSEQKDDPHSNNHRIYNYELVKKPANNITKQALPWNLQGKRKRGRPRNSWQRDLLKEIHDVGLSWLGRRAQNWVGLRKIVDGLCSAGGNRPK